ncbi:DUF4864 domain-containing protein [Marinobacter fuscus]|uniref:DUF4864 domain-containing protein n=1 Tax=Marinobacter fuscus TaxID=2109942 RepID=A0A2T1KTX2_9GAMM|nr:DUF4864 domain-containing protein [Marinobacter fuscus]PSF13540.1 DUF4864 domain-containing protein [Marinobacter fuscus]
MCYRTTFKTRLLLLALGTALALLFLPPAPATASDKDAQIRDTILRQIEAFANDDRELAWAEASIGIKRRFKSAQVFVDMVRQAYPAVHQATAIEFTERVPHGVFEIQAVKLRGPDGKRWQAYYRMVLIEGDWKIAGVRVHPAAPGI